MPGEPRTHGTHRIFRQDSMAVVPPPKTHTVKKTMRSVVLNIICRAYVAVSRMAKAKAMAPRSPAREGTAEELC